MRQTIIVILASIGIIIVTVLPAQTRDVPYTQEDKERIIRLEEGQKAINQRIDGLETSLNKRFDDMNRRFDQMFTLTLWGFGVLFGGMGLLMGFVLWDRRTALAPAIRKTREVEEHSELLEKALKEVAAKNPDVKEALKHVGLM
ncbi:MAG: hypothetical protein HQL06_16915 [Nitrospirae bacterium]|nr:hypothetical protein [Nitrospirota bacterium]